MISASSVNPSNTKHPPNVVLILGDIVDAEPTSSQHWVDKSVSFLYLCTSYYFSQGMVKCIIADGLLGNKQISVISLLMYFILFFTRYGQVHNSRWTIGNRKLILFSHLHGCSTAYLYVALIIERVYLACLYNMYMT